MTDVIDATPDLLSAVDKLGRDVRSAGALVGRDEARELVALYYELQEHRIALNNQARSLAAAERPTAIVDHFARQIGALEKQMVSVLDVFSMSQTAGEWARAQLGVGPVLAAGLLAHIDIERAPTVGHIWRFAGLDPTKKWGKGERRPWNAELKVLCWKLGDSFVKVSGRENAFYGRMYRERKQYELTRDGRDVDGKVIGPASEHNQRTAFETLEQRKITDAATRAIYESGHLPVGRLDLRARRWAVKLFLSHLHHVMYQDRYGEPPPKPYILTPEGGHAHYIAPPSFG